MTKTALLCSLLVAFFSVHNLILGTHGGRTSRHLSGTNPAFKVKAVNLGGWLVTEGWIKPDLFDGIPNKDLLDGTQFQLKSVTIGKYVCAENGGGATLVANRPSASAWETFRLWRIDQNTFNFRVNSNQFAGVQSNGGGPGVVTVANVPGSSETFQIVRNTSDPMRIRIKAPNGLFLQAKTQDLVTADYQGDDGWGDNNPSVFVMTIVGTLRGEYQVTNGYGPTKAGQVMTDHWNTFIVENDFKFISQSGLNAVRIPVGWWIASNPTPKPFVAGSLNALDNAFVWAQKYGIKVIIDLHAVPGSQNGNDHSGTRDGFLEWGKTQDTVDQSVAVIDFLVARYSQNPQLYAVELLNEPHSPQVALDTLTNFYQSGYNAVRKYSSNVYVVMSNRLGEGVDPKELFPLASSLQLTVIDVHYYNLFSDMFSSWNAQQNIDYINNNRSSDLTSITTSNGPLTFVGEWVAEWLVQGATIQDYQNYANAQLKVYGSASFGWAYWALKNVNQPWSMEWMIKNGVINLNN